MLLVHGGGIHDVEEREVCSIPRSNLGGNNSTTPNQQGADVGTQYRSIVLYTNEHQKTDAENFIKELNASTDSTGSPQGDKGAPIITEVKPLTQFFEAEDYHKDYYARNQNKMYCQVVINPKLDKVKKEFAELLK